MKKTKKVIKILLIILAIILMNCFNVINSIASTNIDTANINAVGDCGELLKYKGIVVKTFYAEYIYDGISYPAYCLDKTKSRSIRYQPIISSFSRTSNK